MPQLILLPSTSSYAIDAFIHQTDAETLAKHRNCTIKEVLKKDIQELLKSCLSDIVQSAYLEVIDSIISIAEVPGGTVHLKKSL